MKTIRRESSPYVALLAIAVAMLAGILLTGCGQTAEASDASTARLWGYKGNAVGWVGDEVSGIESAVLVDQETGVEYLLVRYRELWLNGVTGGVSVTPLLNADGTPYKAVE